MKINVAVNLIHRVSSLTNNRTLKQQKKTVFDALRLNDYPAKLINRLMTRMRSTRTTIQSTAESNELGFGSPASENQINTITEAPNNITAEEAPPSNSQTANTVVQSPNITVQEPTAQATVYRSLPYIPVLTPSIRRILKNEFPDVKIAAKTVNTTANILNNNKDPVQPLQQSNVIYRIPCGGCPMSYIGMTKNYLQKRLYGHQTDINKYNRLIDSGITDTSELMNVVGGHTALIEHMIKNKHMFDLSRVKIVDRTYRTVNLPILEMCHISNTTNTVNRRTDLEGLSNTYAGILHAVKTHTIQNNRQLEAQNNVHNNTNTELHTQV